MSKSIKTQSKISKKIVSEKKKFWSKIKILAHSGGWIVLKIIFWSIFGHLLSKKVGFWVKIALFMAILFCKS
jgi:small-conductance mechanosensitive channel